MKDIKVTIDLNFLFNGANGKPAATSQGNLLAPANEHVANFLFTGFSPDKSDKARNRAWSGQLYIDGKLDLDKKQIDAILECCSKGGMADGFYCQLQDYLDAMKELWDATKAEAKKTEE